MGCDQAREDAEDGEKLFHSLIAAENGGEFKAIRWDEENVERSTPNVQRLTPAIFSLMTWAIYKMIVGGSSSLLVDCDQRER
jgi:hypothetical protein